LRVAKEGRPLRSALRLLDFVELSVDVR
jgi:hypothetical protein